MGMGDEGDRDVKLTTVHVEVRNEWNYTSTPLTSSWTATGKGKAHHITVHESPEVDWSYGCTISLNSFLVVGVG